MLSVDKLGWDKIIVGHLGALCDVVDAKSLSLVQEIWQVGPLHCLLPLPLSSGARQTGWHGRFTVYCCTHCTNEIQKMSVVERESKHVYWKKQWKVAHLFCVLMMQCLQWHQLLRIDWDSTHPVVLMYALIIVVFSLHDFLLSATTTERPGQPKWPC